MGKKINYITYEHLASDEEKYKPKAVECYNEIDRILHYNFMCKFLKNLEDVNIPKLGAPKPLIINDEFLVMPGSLKSGKKSYLMVCLTNDKDSYNARGFELCQINKSKPVNRDEYSYLVNLQIQREILSRIKPNSFTDSRRLVVDKEKFHYNKNVLNLPDFTLRYNSEKTTVEMYTAEYIMARDYPDKFCESVKYTSSQGLVNIDINTLKYLMSMIKETYDGYYTEFFYYRLPKRRGEIRAINSLNNIMAIGVRSEDDMDDNSNIINILENSSFIANTKYIKGESFNEFKSNLIYKDVSGLGEFDKTKRQNCLYYKI